MKKRKNYSGSDLCQSFKDFFRKEKKRLSLILIEKGCTDIQLNYGFYYFSGFFKSKTGQCYYISCSDTRGGYNQLLIRTAKDYSDYTGGSNQYCGIDKKDIINFRLV
jgi:hypothetical protein